MASKFPLMAFLVLVSLYLTSGYSLSRRYDISKHDDESYVMATNDHGSPMTVVEDEARTPSPQALLDGSKVVANTAFSQRSSSKSWEKKHKSRKVISVDVETCMRIIIAIVIFIVVICVVYFFYLRPRTKQAQNI